MFSVYSDLSTCIFSRISFFIFHTRKAVASEAGGLSNLIAKDMNAL